MKNKKENSGISIRKSNYVLCIRLGEKSLSKSFFSNEKFENLIKKLEKIDEKNCDCEIKTSIIITDKKCDKRKQVQVHFKSDDLEKIKEKIRFLKNQNKYRIQVRNANSSIYDVKQLAINYKGDLENLYLKLKEMLSIIIEKEFDSMVIFSNEKFTTSHRILVQKVGSCGTEYGKSKMFSIILPNYSSSEVVELLTDKIRGKNEK